MRTLATLLVVVTACGPGGREDGTGGGGNGGGGGSGGDNGENCSDAAKLVYVVDQNNMFSKFDPMTKTFTNIGPLACPSSGTPFSMGVDRNANAWVLYTDGRIYRVDTSNVACTATSWSSSGSITEFGMGFSSNTAGSTDDTLFIAGGQNALFATTSELRTLDTTTMSSSAIGTVQGWPELTGTGNAELWGWFPDESLPRVEQINKANGAAVKTYSLPSLAGTPAAWAFAFWGGDFWIFLMKDFDLSTVVYQVDGASGQIKGMTPTTGRTIVGAGVSTCAPTIIL